jgi:hypothetical protein
VTGGLASLDPSDTFLNQAMVASSYRSNPLFAALQESTYGSGDRPQRGCSLG